MATFSEALAARRAGAEAQALEAPQQFQAVQPQLAPAQPAEALGPPVPTFSEQLSNRRAESERLFAERTTGPLPTGPGPFPGPSPLGRTVGELATEAFTGAERRELIPPEFQASPELIESLFTKEFPETVPVGQQVQLAAGLLAAVDPQGQIDILQKVIPEAQIETDRGGTTNITIGEQRFLLNRPGLSAQDRTQALTQIAAFLPSTKIASLGKTALQRAGLQLLGGAGTSVGIDVAAQQLGAEVPVSPGRAALAGGIGAAAELVPAAVGAVRQARRARELGVQREALEQVEPALRAGQEVAERVEGRLFPAQRTLDPFALEEQAFVAQHPGAAVRAAEQLKAQNAEAHRATVTLLNEIAPEEAVLTAAARTKSAAQLKRDSLVLARKEAASPIYNGAFDEGARVEVTSIVDAIDDRLSNEFVVGPVNQALKKARTAISKSAEVGGEAGSNLKALHGARRTIAEISNKAKGDQATTTQAVLAEIKRDLTAEMKSSSPAYDQARAEFLAGSPAIDAFDESILARIAGLKEANLDAARQQAFKSPASARQVKSAVDAADPSGETWNALVREEAENRLRRVTLEGLSADDFARLTPENAPGQIRRALFGTGRDRRTLLDALDPETKKNAIALEEWLGRAALGRPGGSQTGIRGVIERKLRGASLSIRRFFKQPLITAIETGEDAAYNRSVKSLANVLFDPKWTPRLTKVRLIKDPDTAAREMQKLLNDVAKDLEIPAAEAITRRVPEEVQELETELQSVQQEAQQ